MFSSSIRHTRFSLLTVVQTGALPISVGVEGIDSAHKLSFLASIAFGIPLQYSKVYMEGITKITPEDVKSADHFGYRVKHLGIAKDTGNGIELRVHPTLIPKDVLLPRVNGVMNAVLIRSDEHTSELQSLMRTSYADFFLK